MSLPIVSTFDIEIKNKIQGKGEAREPGFRYCEGWDDKEGMGISFLGVKQSGVKNIQFFDEENLNGFKDVIASSDLITGFSIFGFDVPLLKATLKRTGHDEETGMAGKCYDPFFDIKKALHYKNIKGWTLDNVVKSTLGLEKIGDGANAPNLWQLKKYAELINYLSVDVTVEDALFWHIWEFGWVSNDVVGVERLQLEGINKFKEQFA